MAQLLDLRSASDEQAFRGDAAPSLKQLAPATNSSLRFSVLIVSEIRLLAEGLALALTHETSLTVCGCFSDLNEAISKISLLQPDIIMLNAALKTGVEAVGRLRTLAPQVRVVALAIAEEPENVIAWAEAGAAGYIPSAAAINEVAPLLADIMRGKQACAGPVVAGLLQRLGDMARSNPRGSGMTERAIPTARELQILEMLGAGLSNKEIARNLDIGVATTKSHVHNVLSKLGLERRGQVASWIHEHQPQLRAVFKPPSLRD